MEISVVLSLQRRILDASWTTSFELSLYRTLLNFRGLRFRVHRFREVQELAQDALVDPRHHQLETFMCSTSTHFFCWKKFFLHGATSQRENVCSRGYRLATDLRQLRSWRRMPSWFHDTTNPRQSRQWWPRCRCLVEGVRV